MLRMMFALRRLSLAVLLACFCSACGDGRSSADRRADEGLLVVGNNQEPQNLDPHKATSVADGKIISALLEGLVRPDARRDGCVLPGMAESWQHNEDASVWVFHLREAFWSDGRPVRAGDFVYAYRRLLHPSFGGKYAEMLYVLRGAEAYNRGEGDWDAVGVKAPDDRMLVLSLTGPMPHFLQLLLHFTWFPVPEHAVEAQGGMLDRRSAWTRPGCWVGNGAYVLTERVFNDHLLVRPNPHYWRAGEVKNAGVCFLPVVNGYTETRMYFGGKLHITNNVPPEMLEMAQRRAPGEFCRDDYYCSIFYRLNTTRAPLTDRRVRRALSLAIDREELVGRVVRGAGKVAFALTPPGGGYDAGDGGESLRSQAEREQEARCLLAEAGYPGGRGFPALELMTSSRDVQRLMAETIQAMWARVLGVHVEIRSCEWSAYKAAQQSRDYDISSSSWSGDYLDPATFVELWCSGSGNNCTGWSEPAFDALVQQARSSADAGQRLDCLRRAERLMLEQQPVIPLYWSERTYLKSPRVRGWFPLMLDNHPLDAVELLPAGAAVAADAEEEGRAGR